MKRQYWAVYAHALIEMCSVHLIAVADFAAVVAAVAAEVAVVVDLSFSSQLCLFAFVVEFVIAVAVAVVVDAVVAWIQIDLWQSINECQI